MLTHVNLFALLIFIPAATVLSQAYPPQLILYNVSFGSDPEQIMDVYLPEGRSPYVSKVLVLIHGGGWTSGSKTDFNYAIPFLHTSFPKHAIINLEYRLATVQSPGYPKQINDIQLALQFVKSKSADIQVNPKFGLIGGSAGAHLSLLYGYGFDEAKDVEVICDMVGPTDFTDPSYSADPAFQHALFALVGNYTYAQNPDLYREVSPVTYAKSGSPKTISFYGDIDPLIPKVQGGILEDKLDSVGVYNKYYLYQGAGHGNWNSEQSAHLAKKLTFFFKNYF